MEKFFISKKYNVKVEQNADGTLKVTDLSEQFKGQPLQNAEILEAADIVLSTDDINDRIAIFEIVK